MSTPQKVLDLDEVFDRNAEGCLSAHFNEAMLRQQFVNPLFKEIEAWREELAQNLALRNPELSSRELNFAVQITIARILFLRMCEDRGIELYGQLKNLLTDADVYERLRDLFRKADDRYNSGLFHFHKEKDRAGRPTN